MDELLIRWTRTSATALERLLACAILAGVVIFAVRSAAVLVGMDWSSTDAFYQLIYRILLLVIGVELARTLITHDLEAILEVLAFVVARKTLTPAVTALDILMSVVAFSALLAAKVYFLHRPARHDKQAPALGA